MNTQSGGVKGDAVGLFCFSSAAPVVGRSLAGQDSIKSLGP